MKQNKKLKIIKDKAKLSEKRSPKLRQESFPIVGIGASAGGLEAFLNVFSNMPADTGMAFVFVQHLDPSHSSLSVEIISRSTPLKVEEVRDGTKVLPNHIYVIPPNHNMEIEEGVLKLSARQSQPGQHMAIDYFFKSLARSEKTRAIGIILSGTGTDGTSGLWAIKAEGGMTFAQDPTSAKFPMMPQNAINAGIIDLILPPEDIYKELFRILDHSLIDLSGEKETEIQVMTSSSFGVDEINPDDAQTEDSLRELFAVLESHKRVDFTGYKQTTVLRRVQRRMIVQKVKNLTEYVHHLKSHKEEIHALYNDILINVTEFFRDTEAFKALAENVVPALFDKKEKGSNVRVWVPGCSTGEEVYSIAISLLEYLGSSGRQNPIQIFASDISEHAIQKARFGYYPENSVLGLSRERLERFFDKVEDGYRIKKSVRDLCLFSKHDVTGDPPFAKLDLISCRNVLIYFGKLLQKKVIPILHYALNPSGYLWLGRAENLSEFSNLFYLEDKIHKIYLKTNVPTPMIHFSSKHFQHVQEGSLQSLPSFSSKTNIDLQSEADKLVLLKYSPPGVIINSGLEILQFRGRTAPFLEPANGQASLNLLKMARPEMLASLRVSIQAAKQEKKTIERCGLHFTSDGKHLSVDIEVIPLDPKASDKDRSYLILFKEKKFLEASVSHKPSKGKIFGNSKEQDDKDKSILELMIELAELKDYQQSLIVQYESSQSELTSANEELQSTNEEFQSTNEEIETAKEELQSTNEELTTVNEELQMRNADLTTLSSDLNNLLASIELPILIVGGDFRVRRFSPKAKSSFNLLPSDLGRPIGDIKPSFDVDLSHLIATVSESLTPEKIEIQTHSGKWLRLQIRPYKTIEDKIDGAIISLTDIDDLKKKEEKTAEAFFQSDKDNIAKDVFLATLSHELRTPLSSILMWAQLIAQGKVDFAQAKKGAEAIEHSARVQNQLIDDLLDVSRITSGKLAIEMQPLDPVTIIHRAVESVGHLSQRKLVDIRLDLPSSSEMILADPVRLQQILWNLLTNGIKFSPKAGLLNLKLRYTGEGNDKVAKILVSDKGKGIAPDFLPFIFNRFSQADGTSTRTQGGLGLGLSIVHSLVEMQNGTVIAENASQGSGAVFTLTFPVVSIDQQVERFNYGNTEVSLDPGVTRSADHFRKLKELQVLVVDDDENIREALSVYLKSFGAFVICVDSVAAALETLKSFSPSILISDIAMPGEDGYSLIRKVRALDNVLQSQIPALALSACATEDDIKHSKACGFQEHLVKPVDVKEIAHLILKMVR